MKALLALLISVVFCACGSVSDPSVLDAGPDVEAMGCALENGGCDENADCSDTADEVVCTCKSGYAGDGTTCTELVNCATNNGGCHINADCTGPAGSPVCACSAGYSGDGYSCADTDECMTDNGNCDPTATCMNTVGGRNCTCPADSFGDGLSCRETWSLVGSLSGVDLNPIGRAAVVAGSNNRIFFGPTTGNLAELFFRSFNVNTQTFSANLALPPDAPSDFCACGLTEVFLSDGTNMFLMGSDGARYSTATDSWSTLPNYVGANRRGEAAGSYDANAGSFLLIGGRSNTTSAIHMNYVSPTDSYGSEPGTLPIEMDSAVAHTVAGTSLSYVAGGDSNGGVGLLSHVTGTSTWTRLADAPSPLGRALGMGEFSGLIWVARTNGSLAFYNPASNTWTAHQIDAPAGILGVATVNAETYVISQVDATSAVLIHRLNAIE